MVRDMTLKVAQGGANLREGSRVGERRFPLARKNGGNLPFPRCATLPLKVAQRWRKVAQQGAVCATLRVGALIGPNPWREVAQGSGTLLRWRK